MKHKKILIQSSMFIADLKKNFALLMENIDKNKYNLYSPVSYVKEDNYYQLIGAVVALEKFNPSEINDKISIYFGPASSETEFDYVITVNRIIVEAQEDYVSVSIMPFFIDFNMLKSLHSSKNSDKYFNTIEEAIIFLNEEYINV